MKADEKEKWLIAQVRDAITCGTYSERDVLCLLILLRRHAAPRSAAREFGDFVAHREKDRGILREYLHRVQEAFHSPPNLVPQIKLPVFSVTDVTSSINQVLAAFGLPPFEAETGNQIAVCIISLLQEVRIDTPQKSPVDYLAVAISTSHIALMGRSTVTAGHVFSFPLLVAENHVYEFSLAHEDAPDVSYLSTCNFVVKTYCIAGAFQFEQTKPQLC